MNTTDFLVETNNPAALDSILQSFGAVLVGGGGENPRYVKVRGYYLMRCLGDGGFVKFAVEHQGYAKVVGRADEEGACR